MNKIMIIEAVLKEEKVSSMKLLTNEQKQMYNKALKEYERISDKFNNKKQITWNDKKELYEAGSLIHGITPQGGATEYGEKAADSPQGQLFSNITSLSHQIESMLQGQEEGYSSPRTKFIERYKVKKISSNNKENDKNKFYGVDTDIEPQPDYQKNTIAKITKEILADKYPKN